jgi:thiamine biosynthesis lipoprotein
MTVCDVTFDSMGSDARLVIEGFAPERAAADCRAFLEDFEARLSRFRAGSELCELNRSTAAEVPASALLRTAVRAGLWAAERTGGLVDPTLVAMLEAAGYDRSRRRPELDLPAALLGAPPRAAAHPHPLARWRTVAVDEAAGTVRRPPGVRFDTGGTGKGLAADLLAARLDDCGRWAVDCGGDLRVGGAAAAARPFEVEIAHPLTRETAHVLSLRSGAVATSGLDVRLWRGRDGTPAHHLLDPATGEPAWTGLVGATALAPTALEAEALAKAAILSGPAGARRWLTRHGGLIVRDDGDVELCGPLRPRPMVRVRLAGTRSVAA